MDSRGTPPEMSNFYCLPGRAGGTPKCISRSFGDRGANPQALEVTLGVIDQPGALAAQVTIQRVQSGPQLSRRRNGLSAIRLAPEMMHDRADTIDAFSCIFCFAIPDPPVQSLDLGDDHSLRRRSRRIAGRQRAGDLLKI